MVLCEWKAYIIIIINKLLERFVSDSLEQDSCQVLRKFFVQCYLIVQIHISVLLFQTPCSADRFSFSSCDDPVSLLRFFGSLWCRNNGSKTIIIIMALFITTKNAIEWIWIVKRLCLVLQKKLHMFMKKKIIMCDRVCNKNMWSNAISTWRRREAGKRFHVSMLSQGFNCFLITEARIKVDFYSCWAILMYIPSKLSFGNDTCIFKTLKSIQCLFIWAH